MSASGKSNVTDENLDKYSVELIWRRYTGHMETGKAWKDELKVVLFRQKYGVWWVCKLNTDLIGKARIQTGSSSKSFSDASNSTGTTNIFAVLDYKVHHEIDKLGSGLHFLTNGGPVYGLLLQKTAVSNYNGIAFSYAINNAIICFGYLNGKFSYNYFL